MLPDSLPLRFRSKIKVNTETECWEWCGCTINTGYGRIEHNGRKILAHRYAFTLLVGPIAEGLELDHLCRVRHCVNPLHLEPVTHTENVRRGASGKVNGTRQRAKTHCPSGHAYTADNTYIYRGPRGSSRYCRTCNRERHSR